jgi:uncharacterized delta-60 repeat protein
MTGCAGVTSKTNFAFLRLNENGTPDTTFGIGGGLQTDFKNNQDVAYSSIILDDGKIMVSGTAKDSITNLDFALARYLPDGTLDSNFGSGGKMTYDLKGPLDNGLYMIRQSDGKFLVCGTNNIIGHNSYVVVRFNADGSIDESFGKKGIASLDVASILPDNTPFFVMQPDGKIVMVHNYKDGSNINFLVMRFLNDVVISVNNQTSQDKFCEIYPNPIDDQLNIKLNKNIPQSFIKMRLLNLQFQIIDQRTFNSEELKASEIKLNVSDLSPGYYFIQLSNSYFAEIYFILKE